MTHCRLGRVVWKSRRMVGMATFKTVVSRLMMMAATAMMPSVTQRFGSGGGLRPGQPEPAGASSDAPGAPLPLPRPFRDAIREPPLPAGRSVSLVARPADNLFYYAHAGRPG